MIEQDKEEKKMRMRGNQKREKIKKKGGGK